jgi:hypothetical protein
MEGIPHAKGGGAVEAHQHQREREKIELEERLRGHETEADQSAPVIRPTFLDRWANRHAKLSTHPDADRSFRQPTY